MTSLCSLVLFSNCKKDPDPTVQELLIGKWQLSQFIFHGTNIVKETATNKVAFELEFKDAGAVTFKSTNTDKTTNPPTDHVNTADNHYTWNGDTEMTITATNGMESFSVTGTVSVTETKFVFDATSGDTNELFDHLEGDKL